MKKVDVFNVNKTKDSFYSPLRETIAMWSRNFVIFIFFFSASILGFLREFNYFSEKNILFRTPKALINEMGGGDKRWYFEAALNLHKNGYLTPDNYWIFNLWPPGMVWTNYAILEFVTLKKYYTVGLILFTSFMLALLLTLATKFVLKHTNKTMTFIFLLLVILSSSVQDWIFSEEIYYSDTLGVVFLILFFIVIFKSTIEDKYNISLAIYGGIALAISAYYRSSYYIIHYSLYFVLIILLVLLLKNLIKKISIKNLIEQISFTLVVLLCFKILTIPWINFLETNIRPGNASWTVTQDTGFMYAWVKREDQPDFLKYGGVGWACELEKLLCDEINKIEAATPVPFSGVFGVSINEYKKMTVKAALSNPIPYAQDRIKFFSIAWFSRDGLSMGNEINLLLPTIQLFLFILLFIYLSYLTVSKSKILTAILIISMLLLLAPYLVYHLEVRYVIALKLISFLGIVPINIFAQKFKAKIVDNRINIAWPGPGSNRRPTAFQAVTRTN